MRMNDLPRAVLANRDAMASVCSSFRVRKVKKRCEVDFSLSHKIISGLARSGIIDAKTLIFDLTDRTLVFTTPSTMSDLTKEVEVEKKRKRDSGAPSETRRVKRRVTGIESDHEADIQSEILLLENQILESRKHYNSIVTLLGYSKEHDAEDQRNIAAAVALCRVFCRLMAAGRLTKSRETADDEVIIVQWLKKQIREYEASTLVMLFSEDISRQSTALTLLMRLMREQANYLKLQDDSIWRNGIFTEILQALVGTSAADDRRTEFVEKYLVKYDDIRYHTFAFFT